MSVEFLFNLRNRRRQNQKDLGVYKPCGARGLLSLYMRTCVCVCVCARARAHVDVEGDGWWWHRQCLASNEKT